MSSSGLVVTGGCPASPLLQSLQEEQQRLNVKLSDGREAMEGMETRQETDSSLTPGASPLSHTIDLIDDLLAGATPTVARLESLRSLLLSAVDLRAPADLEAALRSTSGVSADAARGLTSMLQRRSSDAIKVLAEGLPDVHFCTDRHKNRSQRRSWLVLLDEGQASLSSNLFTQLSLPLFCPILEADRLLQNNTQNWTLDMFALDAATDGHCLSYLAFFLFQQRDLFKRLRLDEAVMLNFMQKIEAGYRDVPYHNRTHAASVLHYTNLLIFCPGGLYAHSIVESLLASAMLLAALCHDYGHPGVSNDHLISKCNPLAILYNDKSPLENHHSAAAFKLMMENDDALFQFQAAAPDRIALRGTIIELILATDMKTHFQIHSLLQAGVFSPGSGQTSTQYVLTPEQRLVVMQCALKCADLGHLALPFELHSAWVKRMQDEFYHQGDLERAAGLPVSPLNDRAKPERAVSSQVGFFEVVALPLFTSIRALLPAAEPMLEAALGNYARWRKSASAPSAETCWLVHP